MAAIDLKKALSKVYNPPKGKFTLVDVPDMQFLMIDGHGDPNTSADYQDVVQALYGLAFTLKFALKKKGVEFTVMPLEGLWWIPNMADFLQAPKSDWDWTMMMVLPDEVTPADVEAAREELTRKKNPAALPRIRLERFAEGLAVQIMYLGAYADEGPTIAAMHQFIHDSGYELRGKHHEIYMGDPRRTAPEKLKTIIRQPVQKAD